MIINYLDIPTSGALTFRVLLILSLLRIFLENASDNTYSSLLSQETESGGEMNHQLKQLNLYDPVNDVDDTPIIDDAACKRSGKSIFNSYVYSR